MLNIWIKAQFSDDLWFFIFFIKKVSFCIIRKVNKNKKLEMRKRMEKMLEGESLRGLEAYWWIVETF